MEPSPFSLQNKKILVTGASSGIGRACAILLSQLGAELVLVGRNKEGLEKVLDNLSGKGHSVSIFDLLLFDGIDGWVKALSAGGAFSGLVHCAGEYEVMPIRAITSETYRSLVSINLDSSFALMRAMRQKKVCSNPASIVMISSIAGIVGASGHSAYSASKAAIIGLAKSASIEYARDGIRVNCVSPGYIRTEMTLKKEKLLTQEQIQRIEDSYPLGLGQPSDVACAVAYLLSDASRWVTGTNMIIDGGATSI